jgi:hypothetical protein
MPKEQFKQKVEKELTGLATEPWEIIYFKLYQSQRFRSLSGRSRRRLRCWEATDPEATAWK